MKKYTIAISFFLPSIFACKKLITVASPTTSIVSATVFNNDASASAAVSGIYSRMMASTGFASGDQGSVTFYGSLSSDELINYPSSGTAASIYFYGNNILPSVTGTLWGEIYQYIYTANAGIEGLSDSSTGVSPTIRKQMLGECRFIRAFCYFYLTNLFGNVPLITTTDYTQNQYAARTIQSDIYKQIVSDLQSAESLLNGDYSQIQGEERIRPIKWAAAALLARTYLYMGEWQDAEEQASLVINSGQYTLLNDLTTVFLKNSKETIWSLRPVIPNQNTHEALTFLLTAAPNSAVNNVSLLGKLLNTFEPGDKRRSDWIDSITANEQVYHFPYKYRIAAAPNEPLTEYSMVLRLAEQYLIRAEARAEENNLSGATEDINIIRNRAGLGATKASTQQQLLSAILHERQTELFTEWGHRWLDIKRTNSVDSVMNIACPLKGTQWNTTAQLWPIPLSEIAADHFLTQNPGYTN